MQKSQFSSKRHLDSHLPSLNFITKSSYRNSNTNVTLSFLNQDRSHSCPQEIIQTTNASSKYLHSKATRCIVCIEDPLWKKVCSDVLNMMGPLSVLKIWKSKLGETPSQNKEFDIVCETEEIANFVQQYDFVIITSLQRYFPALKQLRVYAISGI